MSRRLAVNLLLAGALVTSPPLTAKARAGDHEPDRLTACVAVERDDPHCYRRGATYELGRTVWFRGRVHPPRAGGAQVLRRDPGSTSYARVGTATVDERGRVRWSWTANRRDVHPEAPFTFAYRIPGVGRSRTIKVWIVPRHDPETTRRLRACAAVSPTDPHCYNAGVDVEAGGTLFLRGRLTPSGPGPVEVLRQAPGSDRLREIDTVVIRDGGRIRWTWTTRRTDASRRAPYLFALRVPTVARSNLLEVWVR